MFSSILRRNKPFINENMKEYLRKQHHSYTQNIIEKYKGINLLVDKYVKKNELMVFTDSSEDYNWIIPNNQVLQINRISFLAFWGFAMYPLYLYFRYKTLSLFD